MTKARTVKPTEVPGIPKPPAEVSPGLRRYLENLSEAVEIRLGRRGDARDRAITLRELIDSGLAVELANNPLEVGPPPPPPPPPPPSGTTPTAPTGFTVTGGYSLISVFWAYPSYGGHGLTEIWRSSTNVLGDAQLVGVSSGISFVDPVGQSKTFYYWARHVNVYGVIGPYNSATGTVGVTASDVVALLSVLTGAITETQLFSSLNNRINLIDGPTTLAGSVAARILAETNARGTAITNEATARADADTAITNSVNSLTAVVNTKNRVYRQTAAPSSDLVTGDIWYDSDDNNKVYRWDGTSWVPTDDSRIAANAAAIVNESTARADGDSAEATARQTLATQIRGSYTGTDVTQLSAGLVFSERQARSTADSALASRADALESTVNNPTTGVTATANAVSLLTTEVFPNGTAQASYIDQVKATSDSNTAAIQTEATARANADNSLYAQYTVKIDVNGYISGFGLASTLNNATPFSEFLVRADRFSIGAPGRTNIVPFIVVTNPTTLNGVSVPAGVYMDAAFIRNGDITNARIANAAIDDAKIASLSADKIVAGFLDAARISIDGVTLDTVWNPTLSRNVLRIRDLSITNNLIAANAAIDGAKIGSLSVNKLTGDITKFVTGYAVGSGNLPTTNTTLLTMQLPASTHPEGHRPYVQVNVQDQAYGVTLVYVELWSAPVGTGQSTPSLSLGAPASQTYWYEYDWETSTQYQVGWQLNYNGQFDVQVGDTITADTSASGDVASAIYNGSQTIILVSTGASLGSTYTRTRATLGNGVVGNYSLLASTFYDANDMIGVTLFAPESSTLLGRSYQVRLRAQIANRVSIKRVDLLAMGIR